MVGICTMLRLTVLIVVASSACLSTPVERGSLPTFETYARQAAQVLQTTFFINTTVLWSQTGFWNRGCSIHALLRYAQVTGDNNFTSLMSDVLINRPEPYVIPQAHGFFDDMLWWTLANLEASQLSFSRSREVPFDASKLSAGSGSGSPFLDTAKSIFDHVYSQSWTTDQCGGGLRWNETNFYKNAITNELGILACAELAWQLKRSGQEEAATTYLERALDMLHWFEASGMINSDGLVNDGLDDQCHNNNGTTWTYNQGVILGGLVRLHKLTSNTTLLSLAARMAKASLTVLTDESAVITEPSLSGLDAFQFKGIYARYLAELAIELASTSSSALGAQDLTTSEVTIAAALNASATAAAARDRTADGRFGGLWQGPVDPRPPSDPQSMWANQTGTVPQTSALDLLTGAVAAVQQH